MSAKLGWVPGTGGAEAYEASADVFACCAANCIVQCAINVSLRNVEAGGLVGLFKPCLGSAHYPSLVSQSSAHREHGCMLTKLTNGLGFGGQRFGLVGCIC